MPAASPGDSQPCAKRLRGYVAGHLVFDTTAALMVWEDRPYPAYFIPVADVRAGALVPGESEGEWQQYTLQISGVERSKAARARLSGELRDRVRFEWTALDTWLEEDEEVFTHPRDPYTRVDILPSSRRVRVEYDGVVLAASARATVLLETGLPTRWYLPRVDVRMDLLVATDTSTPCPYKGTAHYWAAIIGDQQVPDLAWGYRTPLPESRRVAGLVCFFNEKVDLFVDDELQPKPKLRW